MTPMLWVPCTPPIKARDIASDLTAWRSTDAMAVQSPPVHAQISRGNNYIRRLPPLHWTYFRHDKPELSIRICTRQADNTEKMKNRLTDRQITDLKDKSGGRYLFVFIYLKYNRLINITRLYQCSRFNHNASF